MFEQYLITTKRNKNKPHLFRIHNILSAAWVSLDLGIWWLTKKNISQVRLVQEFEVMTNSLIESCESLFWRQVFDPKLPGAPFLLVKARVATGHPSAIRIPKVILSEINKYQKNPGL